MMTRSVYFFFAYLKYFEDFTNVKSYLDPNVHLGVCVLRIYSLIWEQLQSGPGDISQCYRNINIGSIGLYHFTITERFFSKLVILYNTQYPG